MSPVLGEGLLIVPTETRRGIPDSPHLRMCCNERWSEGHSKSQGRSRCLTYQAAPCYLWHAVLQCWTKISWDREKKAINRVHHVGMKTMPDVCLLGAWFLIHIGHKDWLTYMLGAFLFYSGTLGVCVNVCVIVSCSLLESERLQGWWRRLENSTLLADTVSVKSVAGNLAPPLWVSPGWSWKPGAPPDSERRA